MKFLQIFHCYQAYLNHFYTAFPDVAAMSYKDQIEAFVKDGFAASHIITPYLPKDEFETTLILANAAPAQYQWAKENNFTPKGNNSDVAREIIREQIERFKPQVLYVDESILFDSRFVRSLSWKPDLMIGWRAASIPETVDWTEFDAILSNSHICRETAIRKGAKTTYEFSPGYVERIAQEIAHEEKKWDVVFCGQISPEHKKRLSFLNEVAKYPLTQPRDYSMGYHIYSNDPQFLPLGIHMHLQNAKWGTEMYRALKQGRIVLNIHIDFVYNDEDSVGNMRMFEATGSGSFLLTDYFPKISQYFEPGKEIETFRNQNELIEKIGYFLDHPDEREEIARKGQERCLRDYSMTKRGHEFAEIVNDLFERKFNKKSASTRDTGSKVDSDNQSSSSMFENLQKSIALLETDPALASKNLRILEDENPEVPEIRYALAISFFKLGQVENAVLELDKLLELSPTFEQGKALRDKLLKFINPNK
jgi:hypothetical protein